MSNKELIEKWEKKAEALVKEAEQHPSNILVYAGVIGATIECVEDLKATEPIPEPTEAEREIQELITAWRNSPILEVPELERNRCGLVINQVERILLHGKAIADVPDINVGDIPEGREGEPIMFQTENPNGLHQRYHVEKITAVLNNGIRVTKPVDLGAEYFVMRLDSGGSDPKHIDACRKAVNNYADNIEPHLPELAADLRRRYPVPTPADPGSQVETVGLLKWVAEIDLVYLEDKKGWFGKTNWKHDGVNHEQLITLYKQSL